MDKRIYELIDGYRDEFTQTLKSWIQIPSVKGEAEEGAPFGRTVREMLDRAIADADRINFEHGGGYGHVQLRILQGA